MRYLSEAGPPQVAQLTVQANCGTEVPTTSAPRENPSMLSVGSPPSGQSKRSRDLSPPVAGRLDAENPPRPAPPALRQNTPGASRSIPLRSSLPWSQQTALLISRQSPALGSRVSSGGSGAIIFTQDDQNFLLARGVKILSMQRRQANMQDYWTGLADGVSSKQILHDHLDEC